MLPILHLNGNKIASPMVLARVPEPELLQLLEGYGHRPYIVSGDDPDDVHRQLAAVMESALDDIRADPTPGRSGNPADHPGWPMIVFRTPKGWTGPAEVDGVPVEGTFRSHQVPLANVRDNPEHLATLEVWMRHYRPEELFGDDGRIEDWVVEWTLIGQRRMSANPHTNGGLLLRDLDLPDFRNHGVDVPKPGATEGEPTRVLGSWLRDVTVANSDRFPIVGPDETDSNRLQGGIRVHRSGLERRNRRRRRPPLPRPPSHGVLSEHLCEGVGEHAPVIRAAATERLQFRGAAVDPARNAGTQGDGDISADNAPVRTVVVSAREDLEIARGVGHALASRVSFDHQSACG